MPLSFIFYHFSLPLIIYYSLALYIIKFLVTFFVFSNVYVSLAVIVVLFIELIL